ncbi:MAG: YjdF family protein [Lactococcus lactis]|uniref:YjdF family protein n=1 Tax=Pseudolactococcus carnosus TaxID=2749961 RepID=UPI001C4F133C|nr:YjdF family protein [Lactococcus carnosus]MBR2541923.1 YjdF family protein [Lactococcus sp.]MCJ1978911.1 YjdF family protein [Lactococcus carnosus]MDN5441017.1 YjdF family protein [Lactococcus lactis]MDN5463748.1 YjdF family protein [Lactococcus lactis]
MNTISVTLTILFEPPFWVGIFEQRFDNKIEVAKVTFGSEPKDYEVYSYILDHYYELRFSPPIEDEIFYKKKVNPKRLQKLAKKQMIESGVGTKAQKALKLQQEQGKLKHKKLSRNQREIEKKRQFDLRQKKRNEKHKGH